MKRAVTVQPGYVEANFDALLASRQFVVANLFTITPLQGAVVRLCDAQEDVSVVSWNSANRYTYAARQAVISGLRARSTIGMEVDEQSISIAYAQATLFQNWQPWPVALLQGRLDGARISRDWAVASSFGGPWVGVVRMFDGLVSELESVGRSIASLKVKSDLERLNIQMPRDLYTPVCKNTLGDAKCGIDLNALGVLGAVGAGATSTRLPWSSSATTYAFGKVHISNGDSVTRVRTILKADASALTLCYPLDFVPAASLQFTAFPGCSRLAARCQVLQGALWANRFGGTPYIPVAETAF